MFIIGAPRSGTSILYRTLQKHSSFKSREENLQETKLLNYANCSHVFKGNEPKALFHYMLNDQRYYQQFLDSIRPIQHLHELVPRSFNCVLSGRLPFWWRLNLNAPVVQAYFYFASKARECKRLLEKSPGNLYHVERLRVAFPLCKMLFIYRHPLDVYTSYCKRKKIDPDATWTDMSPEKFVKLYSTTIDKACVCKDRYEEQLLMVKYEEFTAHTEKTLSDICDFIHEPMQREMLVESNPDPKKWEIDPHLFCAITSKVKNWQDFVGSETGRQIEDLLCRHMDKLEYPRYTQEPVGE